MSVGLPQNFGGLVTQHIANFLCDKNYHYASIFVECLGCSDRSFVSQYIWYFEQSISTVNALETYAQKLLKKQPQQQTTVTHILLCYPRY